MIRKNLLTIALFTIIAFAAGCGGGNAPSSSKPDGVNAGIPSVVQLLPIQTIVQTNSQIDIKAKILDGNGNPVSNVPVTFINLSPIGTFLSGPEEAPSEAQAAVSNIVLTDVNGFATLKVSSSQEGFLTILVEINVGQGQVRDKQTIFFTSSDTLRITPSMTLEVDAEGDDSWDNQPPNPPFDDFILLEASGDDTVLIRTTVKSGIGLPVSGSKVTFGADRAFRIGMDPTAACSDGSEICDIAFISGNVVTTDSAGQATVTLQVTPEALNSIQTLFNVTASADNGAAGIVTLFLDPVTIFDVALSANPTVVEPLATSDLTAFVTTNLGGIAPDDTAVMFSTAPTTPGTDPNPCGSVTPFGQTINGSAISTFTAPAAEGTCTVTAISNGVFDTVDITVAMAAGDLRIVPGNFPIDGAAGGTATFTIFNGTPGYSVFLDDPALTPDPANPAGSGDTFDVVVGPGTCPHDVTVTVFDSVGGSVTATITITVPAMTVTPPSATICENTALCIGAFSDTAAFDIDGGVSPYSGSSTNTVVIPNPVIAGDGTFTVNAVNGSLIVNALSISTVSISITDSCGTALADDIAVDVIDDP